MQRFLLASRTADIAIFFSQPSRPISHQRDRCPRFVLSVGTNAQTIRYAPVEDLAAQAHGGSVENGNYGE